MAADCEPLPLPELVEGRLSKAIFSGYVAMVADCDIFSGICSNQING